MSNELLSLESWYDDQFSIERFKDNLVRSNEKTDAILRSVAEIISDTDSDYESEEKYVVNLDGDIKDKIKKGLVKLDTNKDGEVYAQLRTSDGKYGEKLSIRKELEEKGLSAKEVEMAMQMKAIQDVLVQIVDVLNDIGEHVCDVIIGQQNDRIGLYYSGMNLFVESQSITDEYLKKLVVSQAIKALNDANAQMVQQLRSDIQYLAQKKYKTIKGNRQEKIDEKIADIYNCYDIVYRSSFMKAALYNEIGELPAMLTACEEYGRFIEKLIIPNNAMLTEMDKTDILLEKTKWEKKADVLIQCNEVKSILNNPTKTYYLIGKGESDNG